MRSIVLSLILLGVSIATGHAAVLQPGKAIDVVALIQSGVACPQAGSAIDLRETSDAAVAPFVVPPKKVLVVTGFEWSGRNGTPGTTVEAILSTQSPTDISIADYATSTTTFASNGSASKNELTPPIVIKPGRTICIFTTAGLFNAALVHGFLAPDK